MSSNVAHETDGRRHRRLRNVLINRRFQLKYTAMIVGVASVISIVLGVFLIEKVRENSRMLQLETDLDEVFQSQLAHADAQTVLVLIGAFVIFNLLLAVMGILITHRIVGPIFVIRRYVRELGDGKIPKLRKLRRGDEFVELYESLQDTVASLERRAQRDLIFFEGVLASLEDDEGPKAESLRTELRVLIEEKRKMLAREQQDTISLDVRLTG